MDSITLNPIWTKRLDRMVSIFWQPRLVVTKCMGHNSWPCDWIVWWNGFRQASMNVFHVSAYIHKTTCHASVSKWENNEVVTDYCFLKLVLLLLWAKSLDFLHVCYVLMKDFLNLHNTISLRIVYLV